MNNYLLDLELPRTNSLSKSLIEKTHVNVSVLKSPKTHKTQSITTSAECPLFPDPKVTNYLKRGQTYDAAFQTLPPKRSDSTSLGQDASVRDDRHRTGRVDLVHMGKIREST
jgi:hypothetical protein